MFSCVISYSQESKLINNLRHYQLDSVFVLLQNKDLPNIKWQINFLKEFNTKLKVVNIDTINSYSKNNYTEEFYSFINKGDIYFYKYLDKNIEALTNYNKGLELAEIKKDTLLINEALKKILTLHRLDALYDNTTYLNYLKKYQKTSKDSIDKAYYHYYNLILNFKNYNSDEWNIISYNYLNNYFKFHEASYLKGICYTVYASYFEEKKQNDSIWYYINEAEKSLNSINENYKKSRLRQLYAFTSRIAVAEGNTKKASDALNNINPNFYNKIDYKLEANKLYYQAVVDTINGNYKSAFNNYIKSVLVVDSLQEQEYNNLLNEFDIKYQTEKKEKQNILLQSEIEKEKREQRNLWIIGITILLIGSIISFLLFKNTKRKQRIAEQEREIEIQKTEKLLKEQELSSIDAMIEGQEKERQRLASDLHDSVGATLSAARLQFEHLQKHKGSLPNEDELFSKTGKLLEEAYQEVRSMAHIKNSGVLAKLGLLPAIEKLARNVSVSKLHLEVKDFGLNERINNTLEITIFRIIQELVTNIIKHANASEASISLTQIENTLNIIVEDNGIGFNPREVSLNTDGMGLGNIEKRIEYLEGTLEIDSTPGKGTNILIDIPI